MYRFPGMIRWVTKTKVFFENASTTGQYPKRIKQGHECGQEKQWKWSRKVADKCHRLARSKNCHFPFNVWPDMEINYFFGNKWKKTILMKKARSKLLERAQTGCFKEAGITEGKLHPGTFLNLRWYVTNERGSPCFTLQTSLIQGVPHSENLSKPKEPIV